MCILQKARKFSYYFSKCYWSEFVRLIERFLKDILEKITKKLQKFTKNIFHNTYLQLFRYIYILWINNDKNRQNKKYSYIIYTEDNKIKNIIHWVEIPPPYEQSSCSGEFHCFRILRREEEKLKIALTQCRLM